MPAAAGGERTRIYLVCSPLGGVGKTMTARLLLDHALGLSTKARGFDTNHLDPDLEQLFPLVTTAVDLSTTRGQMAFFDRLVVPDGAPKVVDLWHATYDLFWTQADSLGFFAEAKAQGVELVAFLLADRKDRFVQEARMLPGLYPDVKLVLVHDTALMETARSEEGRINLVGAKRLLIVPELDSATRRMVEEPGLLANKLRGSGSGQGLGAGEGRTLIKRIFDQLKFIELSLARAG